MRDRLYLFFIATYFAQGMVGIAYVPIFYLQKDMLGLSAGGSAVFTAVMTLPLLAKPLLGAVTDAMPFGRRRRFPYLLLASAATTAGWAALALLKGYAYAPVLVLLTLVNVSMAFCDVLCDGVMVEHGKKKGKTGSYQAAQIATLYLTVLFTGLGGGWLAEHMSYAFIFGATAVFPLLIFATAFTVPESPSKPPEQQARLLWRGMTSMLRKRSFWSACLVILLFDFVPFQGTTLFYYQSETLGFSKVLIGALTSISGATGFLGAALFGWLYGRRLGLRGRPFVLDTRLLIRLSVLTGAPLTLLYLAYRGPASAVLLTAFFGAVGVVMRLSLMDVAAKSCPEHGEATAFAVFMSVFNLAAWGSNTAGAKVYDLLKPSLGAHGSLAALILTASACTLACWPFLDSLQSEGGGLRRLSPASRDGRSA